MPFTQSQKTKSQEPLQRICSSPVGASAGKKKKRANAPTIAQIVEIIFAFIIWKFMVWKLRMQDCPAPSLLLFNPFIQNVLVWVCSIIYCKGKCFCQSGAARINRNSLHRDISSEIRFFLVKYNSVHNLNIYSLKIIASLAYRITPWWSLIAFLAQKFTSVLNPWKFTLNILIRPIAKGAVCYDLILHNVVWFDYGCKGKHNFYISKKFFTFYRKFMLLLSENFG